MQTIRQELKSLQKCMKGHGHHIRMVRSVVMLKYGRATYAKIIQCWVLKVKQKTIKNEQRCKDSVLGHDTFQKRVFL